MVKITCINKDNGDHDDPNEGITHLGWVNETTGKSGISTRSEMVQYIEGGNKAYTRNAIGGHTWLVVRVSRWGNKYVKTISNGRESDNLLALSECPRY